MSPTVFIIEDDVDTREMLAKFLELEGYALKLARPTDGRRSIGSASGADACVIVLDLMMPVMDGWEFRRHQVEDAAACEASRRSSSRPPAASGWRRSAPTPTSSKPSTWTNCCRASRSSVPSERVYFFRPVSLSASTGFSASGSLTVVAAVAASADRRSRARRSFNRLDA